MRGTAVCLGGLLHSLREVAPSIQRFLVEPLDADLFIAGPLQAVADWAPALAYFPTLAQVRLEKENVTQVLKNSPTQGQGWQGVVHIKGNWLGCLESEQADGADMQRNGSGLCQMYSHKLCLEMVTDWEQRRQKNYDRVIYSRADFEWLGPHLPLAYLPAGELWIVDGEDNGGVNDRHWVMSRSVAPFLLNSWGMLLDGTLADSFGKLSYPGLSTEMYFHFLMVKTGLIKFVRRMPASAFVRCAHHHNRKWIDTSAVGLSDSRRLGEVNVRCQRGGAKYRHEYASAKAVTDCAGSSWSWTALWKCWCSDKSKIGMLVYDDYRLCMRVSMWVSGD